MKQRRGKRSKRRSRPETDLEPGGVVEERERRPVGRVVALKVLDEHLVDALGIGRIAAAVAHRAAASVQVLPTLPPRRSFSWLQSSSWSSRIPATLLQEMS